VFNDFDDPESKIFHENGTHGELKHHSLLIHIWPPSSAFYGQLATDL
jgi:hypothetical protein